MVPRVISLILSNLNKFQDQFMIITIKIQFLIWVWNNIQKHYMVSTTNLINKKKPAIRGKNNTFTDVKAKVQEHIYPLNLFICHWRKKHPNSLFPKMIEDYSQRNSGMSQVQEITKTTPKALRYEIKFKHSQCQGHQEM